MLLALLYCEHDRIAAAAFACDQTPYGERYWEEIHAAPIEPGSIRETAYVTVNDPDLRERLLRIGFDYESDGKVLARLIEETTTRDRVPGRAA